MNQNEFKPIQPIGKKQTEPLPIAQPAAVADPVTRIVQELTRNNTLLQDLASRVEALEKRGIPATAKEVALLTEKAQQGVAITIDSQKVADLLMPPLNTSLQDATRRIEKAAHSSAQAWAGRIGFTSAKAALTILGTCFLVTVGAIWYASQQYAQAQAAQQTVSEATNKVNFYQAYDTWLDKAHPKIWPEYEKILHGGKKMKKR
jgi:hypothetical protein